MGNMSENKEFKFKRGKIIIEAQSVNTERFLNLLWKNKVDIKRVRRVNVATILMYVKLNDYNTILEVADKTNTKISIVGRSGMEFYWMKLKNRMFLIVGLAAFGALIYLLSTFIWGVYIVTERNLSPYEVRQELLAMGIKAGISKSDINVSELEDKLQKVNDNIAWVRVRIDGSRLNINVAERVAPPKSVIETDPCNLVAKRDGQVKSMYTTAGTIVVKKNEIVKKGQVLVKGEQGKEGLTYPVHSDGKVMATTYYDAAKQIQVKGTKRERTGKRIENIYIELNGKKVYLKNNLKLYANYDKIEEKNGFLKKEIYYEVKEKAFTKDVQKTINDVSSEMYSRIVVQLDKSVKIVDKKFEAIPDGDYYNIRVMVLAEENIAIKEKIQ